MRHISVSSFTAVLVWLTLVSLLFGHMVITPSATTGTSYDRGEVQQLDHGADSVPRADAPQWYHSSEAQLAAVESGRRGVTEQPGRRGVIEQSGRPGAVPDQVIRERTPTSGRSPLIIVEAMLNRHVSVPLILDTGATHTVLTRQTAHDLGITGLERLPKQRFQTPGGPIQAPVTTLKSIRVGTVEAQDVAVAIDLAGHLDIGLLGMTFMRYFKVTVDHAQGQARFEPR